MKHFLVMGQELGIKGISGEMEADQSSPKMTFKQIKEFEQEGLPNQDVPIEELNLETSGIRVMPEKTENQDISGIDMDDCSDSEVNISEEN